MNCFIWWITEDLIQVIASQIVLQTLSKRQRRSQNIQEIFVKITSQIVKYQKIAAKEKQTSQVNGFNIFSVYGKMQVSGLNEIIHVIFILTIQGPCPVFFFFFSSLIPSGCTIQVAAVADALKMQQPLLIYMVTFFVHKSSSSGCARFLEY